MAHFIALIYDWLVANTLWHAVVTFSVGFILARTLAWRPLKKLHSTQEAIQDALNTSTPGGLSSVVSAIDDLKTKSAVPLDNDSRPVE